MSEMSLVEGWELTQRNRSENKEIKGKLRFWVYSPIEGFS